MIFSTSVFAWEGMDWNDGLPIKANSEEHINSEDEYGDPYGVSIKEYFIIVENNQSPIFRVFKIKLTPSWHKVQSLCALVNRGDNFFGFFRHFFIKIFPNLQ